MKKQLIMNDLKAGRLAAVSTGIFMAVSAMLLGLSILLFGNLFVSIDCLMTKAQTPDFLQMHTGEISEEALTRFADSRDDVEKMQISRFLNLPGSRLALGGQPLLNSTQDNGLSCQNPSFDYLIDAENRIIRPAPGEVYVPVCYRQEYGLETGDVLEIGSEKLLIAGFLRDSQMNSMMASSKRFLVHEDDYKRILPLGSEEYLIEFMLKENASLNAFAAEYGDAGMPGNGPVITRPLIRMINALSDGMMILVILLISAVVLFISILCIRYMILTQMEKDKREIGMLKAVGISGKGIRSLYFAKYLLLSAAGCLAGTAAALITAGPLGAQMRELYGDPGNRGIIYALMIIGSMAAEGIILLSVYRLLGRMEKISALEALYGRGISRKKNLFLPAGIIAAAAVFMILMPLNTASTIAAPGFAASMGIGDSQIRIDIRQTDKVKETAAMLAEEISRDERVADFALMQTGSYKTILPDGTAGSLLIENGDHGRFPVRYSEGRFPEARDEIALSLLNAEELQVKTGDRIRVITETGEQEPQEVSCRVCGIYSDITNGGKTAKACFDDAENTVPVMWSILYLSLKDESRAGEWVSEYQQKHSPAGDGVKVVEIADYLKGTYGQTIRNVQKASAVAVILACLILFVVILLLLRLVLWRERNDSSFKKALGFTSADIRKEYLKRTVKYLLPGIAAGLFAGIVPGQYLAGMLLGAMGAGGFHFIIDPVKVFVLTPALIAAAASGAVFAGLREVDRIRAYECLGAGRE